MGLPPLEERVLERFKVAHPVERKLVRLDVGLVEHEEERESGLVQDAVAGGQSARGWSSLPESRSGGVQVAEISRIETRDVRAGIEHVAHESGGGRWSGACR